MSSLLDELLSRKTLKVSFITTPQQFKQISMYKEIARLLVSRPTPLHQQLLENVRIFISTDHRSQQALKRKVHRDVQVVLAQVGTR